MLRLMLFRRGNRILEINEGKFQFIDVFKNDSDELLYHNQYAKSPKKETTNGFYYVGKQDDIIMFYIENLVPKIKYGENIYNLLDKSLKFNCKMLDENDWLFECKSSNSSFHFIYKPYFYDSFDDDETDVNFGLWLMSIIQNPQKLARVIDSN